MLDELFKTDCIKYGKFTLKSNEKVRAAWSKFLNFCNFSKKYLWLLYIYSKHKDSKRYFLYIDLYHFLLSK